LKKKFIGQAKQLHGTQKQQGSFGVAKVNTRALTRGRQGDLLDGDFGDFWWVTNAWMFF